MRYAAHFNRCAIALALSIPLLSGPAGARDRGPSPEDVIGKLHDMGFVSWRRLRWDHGDWKIDDAVRRNGRVYDMRIEAGTLDLVHLDREDH